MSDRKQYQKDYRAKRKAAGWKREYTLEEYARVVEKASKWNKENKDRRRKQLCNSPDANRQQRYGLTPEKYKKMYDSQNGLCALGCGRPIQCVDHCHNTEQVRELLCRRCNSALGMLSDDPMLMIKAAEYVVRHRASFNIAEGL